MVKRSNRANGPPNRAHGTSVRASEGVVDAEFAVAENRAKRRGVRRRVRGRRSAPALFLSRDSRENSRAIQTPKPKAPGGGALHDADATFPRASEVAIDCGPDESGPLSHSAHMYTSCIDPEQRSVLICRHENPATKRRFEPSLSWADSEICLCCAFRPCGSGLRVFAKLPDCVRPVRTPHLGPKRHHESTGNPILLSNRLDDWSLPSIRPSIYCSVQPYRASRGKEIIRRRLYARDHDLPDLFHLVVI
jgi:hypothetical protein